MVLLLLLLLLKSPQLLLLQQPQLLPLPPPLPLVLVLLLRLRLPSLTHGLNRRFARAKTTVRRPGLKVSTPAHIKTPRLVS